MLDKAPPMPTLHPETAFVTWCIPIHCTLPNYGLISTLCHNVPVVTPQCAIESSCLVVRCHAIRDALPRLVALLGVQFAPGTVAAEGPVCARNSLLSLSPLIQNRET